MGGEGHGRRSQGVQNASLGECQNRVLEEAAWLSQDVPAVPQTGMCSWLWISVSGHFSTVASHSFLHGSGAHLPPEAAFGAAWQPSHPPHTRGFIVPFLMDPPELR